MEQHIYTVYATMHDMTFIMCDTNDGEELISTKVVGWYYGEPNDEDTEAYTGKLIAEYGEEGITYA